MSIEANSVVLKKEIADSLLSRNSAFPNYKTETSRYTADNIKQLFATAPYIDPNSFDVSVFCKNLAFPTTADLFAINRTADDAISGEIIRFDTLSAMYLSTAISLTNIRYSSFNFIEFKNGRYSESTYYGNVALADKAIKAENSYSFANNLNTGNSRKLIDTEEKFLQYSGINSELAIYRNALVKGEYTADSVSENLVSANVASRLSTMFLNGLNKIRTDLSCKFSDSELRVDVTLTYWKTVDGSGTTKSTYTHSKYSYVNAEAYMWTIDESEAFLGWSTTKSSKTAQYAVNDEILMDRNIVLYPVIQKKYYVRYHGKNSGGPSFINEGSTAMNYLIDGSDYRIKGIGTHTQTSLPLYYTDESVEGFYAFKGYSGRANGTIYKDAGETISNISRNYELYPIFGDKSSSLELDQYQMWEVNDYNAAEQGEPHIVPSDKVFRWGETPNGRSGDMVCGTHVPINIDLGVAAKYVRQMKFTFTGYINEVNKTHAPHAGEQAQNPGNVDSSGYAKVYVSSIKFGGVELVSKLTNYSLNPTSITNWWLNVGSKLYPVNDVRWGNLQRYYYNRRNTSVFKNLSFSDKVGTKPVLFAYTFINQTGTLWPWNGHNDNGTLNCFAVVNGRLDALSRVSNWVKIETNWVDVNSTSNNKHLNVQFGIAEKCSGRGKYGGYGGSFGKVYLTNVEFKG